MDIMCNSLKYASLFIYNVDEDGPVALYVFEKGKNMGEYNPVSR